MNNKWTLVAILTVGVMTGLVIGKYYDIAHSVAQPSPDPRTGGLTSERAKIRQELQAHKEAYCKPFISVVKFIQPSVVSISTKKTIMVYDDFFGGFFGRAPQTQSTQVGSGVIVDEKGYILTNYHVVEGADEIKVALFDGREVIGKVIGRDKTTELAVVRITADNLTPAILGDSEKVEVGELVMAVGSPFGLGNTVTSGIVSAKRDPRKLDIPLDYEDFIQTDAAINPGNSGGPLVALSGEVVGINTMIITRSGGYQGVGFAVPINRARYIMNKLIDTGKVVRPFLGVRLSQINKSLALSYGLESVEDLLKELKMPKSQGVFVVGVEPDSKAEKAGLMEGDVILDIDGQALSQPDDLSNIIAKKEVGAGIAIKVIRNGKEQTISATIGERR